MDKRLRNELLGELEDANNIIDDLEFAKKNKTATENQINQLLYAYDIKLKIIDKLNNI